MALSEFDTTIRRISGALSPAVSGVAEQKNIALEVLETLAAKGFITQMDEQRQPREKVYKCVVDTLHDAHVPKAHRPTVAHTIVDILIDKGLA